MSKVLLIWPTSHPLERDVWCEGIPNIGGQQVWMSCFYVFLTSHVNYKCYVDS